MTNTKESLENILAYDHWRHRVQLAPGLFTQGYNTVDDEWERNYLPANLNGKSFLDVGANDGFYSFEAEKRGATRITAIDIYTGDANTMTGGWDIKGITLLKNYLNSKVEIENLSIFDLSTKKTNWDVVFCSDVLSWLTDIPAAIKQLTEVCTETLIIKDTFSLDNTEYKLRTHHYGKGEIYRMNLKYLEQELDKVNYQIKEVHRLFTYEQYRWQAKTFPMVLSKGTIGIYKSPFEQNPFSEKTIKGEWLLSMYKDFLYVKDTGWVKKSEVLIENRYQENPVKRLAKRLMSKTMLESYYAKNNNEKNIGEKIIIAEKKAL